jgi:hypothetical protein
MLLLALHSKRRRVQLLQLMKSCLEMERVERPTIPDERVDFERMADADALVDFRFTVSQLKHITAALRVPDVLTTKSRDRALGIEALAMLLRRLVYPNRLSDIRKQFGRSESACCRIILHTGFSKCLFRYH